MSDKLDSAKLSDAAKTAPEENIAGANVNRILIEAEEKLAALESVLECKVILRRVAGQPTQSESIVAYVVPNGSVGGDRVDEWMASLRKQLPYTSVAEDPPRCELIAVARLPLTDDGQIDQAALAGLPLLDDELTHRWEERLKSLSGVRDAMVLVDQERAQLPPIHYSELFPEPARVEGSGVPVSEPPGERSRISPPNESGEHPIAISHGGELEGAGQLPILLGETLERAARECPDHGVRTIGVDGTETFLSYPELLATAERLLGGLQKAGLRPGERLIFQFKNNRDFLIAFWACVLGGLVPVPMTPQHQGPSGAGDKLQKVWEMLTPRLVLTTRELAMRIRPLGGSGNRVACVEDLFEGGARGEWHRAEPTDLALVMLTSGSTGMPKGVMLSHRNLIRRSAGSAQMNGFSHDAVTLNWMPLDHVAGIVYFHLRDVFLGSQQIHAATDLVLQDPLIWMEWVNRYRVTITFAPNFAYGLVNERSIEIPARASEGFGTWDLSCLRQVLNGAEAIVPRTARRFLQLLAPYGLSPAVMWPAWGMSETSSGTIYSENFRLDSTDDNDVFVEVGRPIPGFCVRIVDPDDQPVFENSIGALQVKGDVLTAGYFSQPDLTAESFTADGWFRTGDLGFLSKGRLTITGRQKDVIIINSVNYPCHEIEGVVEEIQGVEPSYTAACAVRGSGADTDQLAIFFHPVAGCEAISAELVKTIRGSVSQRLGVSPDFLLPVERDAIPKTNIGKIQRAQLAASFARGEFSDVLRRVDVLLSGANTLPAWFYQPVWRRAELRGQRESGPMLVFADSNGLGESIQRKAAAGGCRCLLVSSGPEFSEQGERLTMDPGNSAHYRRVMEVLARRGIEPQSIVHLFSYQGIHSRSDEPDHLEPVQQNGVLSVLHLVQALKMETTGRTVRLMVAAEGMQDAEPFEKGPTLGLLKTIPQENPQVSCCHVELPVASDEDNAALVLRELMGHGRDVEVAYRGGHRCVRRMRRADFRSETAGPLPLEEGGLYLLSGGLGGIGLELATYLLKEFGAHLLLIGRSKVGTDPDRTTALRTLEALAASTGGDVSYAALDVGDVGGLREVVGRSEGVVKRRLDGVFHLAGAYHECQLADETAEGLSEILHPKLKGTWALHQLLAQRPGALFVSFSSVNGFLGGYGVGAYAAANACLESFSEYQRELTHTKAYCLSWSLWDDVGMSRGYVLKDVARERGFCSISPRQGLSSLLAALRRSPGHTIIGLDGTNLHIRHLIEDLSLPAQALTGLVTGDSNAIAQLTSGARGSDIGIPDRYGTPTLCYLKPAPEAALDGSGRIDREKALSLSRRGARAASQVLSPEGELESTIANIWREVLKVEQLGVTDNFFDIGGNSLRMGQVNHRLQSALERKISMTDMFRFSTVRALAVHLADSDKSASPPKLDANQSRGERRRELLLRRRPS